MGMIAFGNIARGHHLGPHANFESLGMALITLFRVATNDGWVGIARDCQRPRLCGPGVGECGTEFVLPFFYSFIILVSIVLVSTCTVC
jgi:hypothetical protein